MIAYEGMGEVVRAIKSTNTWIMAQSVGGRVKVKVAHIISLRMVEVMLPNLPNQIFRAEATLSNGEVVWLKESYQLSDIERFIDRFGQTEAFS